MILLGFPRGYGEQRRKVAADVVESGGAGAFDEVGANGRNGAEAEVDYAPTVLCLTNSPL